MFQSISKCLYPKASSIFQSSSKYFYPKVPCSSFSISVTEKNQLITNLMDYYANQNAGLAMTAYQLRWMVKDEFMSIDLASDEHVNHTLNVLRLTAYVCGRDGFSEEERNNVIYRLSQWNPCISQEKLHETASAAVLLTPKELAKLCAEMEDFPFTKGMLYCIIVDASVDGFSDAEQDGFSEVSKLLGITDDDVSKLHKMYRNECALQQEFHDNFGFTDEAEIVKTM